MGIRAVLWDIDDTIFDYTTADRLGMHKHLEHEGLPDGYENVEQALVVWRELTDVHWARFAAGETDFQGQRRERVREFLSRPLGDAEADGWFARHAAHYEAAWSLFPDVLPTLDLLADGFRHAVLSNAGIHNQDRKLRRLGVRDRFEAMVCAVELGISKPDAGAFHAGCEALALEPREVAYVGNEPDIDAGGAAAAGLMGIWLDRGGLGGRPELIRISGLDQLPGLLAGNTRFGAPDTFG
ncbi:HAD family hydrolase [Streptomyces sp. NBC_00825]|uniref:HAD family hydrolase n=1 Tax=unclassified Streptomyces TaxID=2593676 RepID=UPI00224E903D|nr:MULTISPECIES: HAD family hydrolase [unclassified Streptomyces]WTB57052.1 HAD family hydrolase [Streptomyces sp. NBC_00826]WTH90064.1 HAD family hydrolase [Streptomyces sp. NBC_00825]WTH98792.1 HAD family hydrolase [Streptomyces sp. NBC_00822]MCX4864184.1 HAD family hydrolase [Streptomyces sp. NBC_00906]MCX4895422.1 HAD family hydrolase [Streptomyces sp. NBC_00892]